MLDKELSPKVSQAEIGGYTMTAKVVRKAGHFIYCFAQAGDDLGIITLKGPDVNVSAGCRIPLLPRLPFCETLLVNLTGTGSQGARTELQNALVAKYNREVDWSIFNTLADQVLKPY